MIYMRFMRFIKLYALEIAFLTLIAFFFYLYFVVYLTPSRTAWYTEMQNQITILIDEITTIGR